MTSYSRWFEGFCLIWLHQYASSADTCNYLCWSSSPHASQRLGNCSFNS